MAGGLTHFADVYKGNEATFDAMGQQLAGLAKQNYGARRGIVQHPRRRRFHLGGSEIKTLLDNMQPYREELVAVAAKNHIAATETNLLNLAQGKGRVGAKALATAASGSGCRGSPERDRVAGPSRGKRMARRLPLTTSRLRSTTSTGDSSTPVLPPGSCSSRSTTRPGR
jgi:hypothetical protein